MDSVNVKELRKIARSSPLNQNGGLVFRLLELTRLNRKSDVYHILLRVYVARGEPFPTLLSNLFTLRNSESFKIGVYGGHIHENERVNRYGYF